MLKTVAREFKVFYFDELSDGAKEKAIQEYSDINVDHEWWDYDGKLDLSEAEMKAVHIKMREKWWEHVGNIPGEYPAYTGLFKHGAISFDIDRRSYLQFKDLTVMDDNIFRLWLRIPKWLWEHCSYSFNDGRENSTRIEFEHDERDFTPRERDIIIRSEQIFSGKVHEALVGLRREYEYQTGNEAITETIKINDYRFFEDGSPSKVLCANALEEVTA
jgi:hypothetical protein